MTKEQFEKLAIETERNFAGNMHTCHQDKNPSWQFLIQLNTDLPYDDKLSYNLPIEMYGIEDSEEKTRSIVLWRILHGNVSVDTIKFAAEKIDEIRYRLQQVS